MENASKALLMAAGVLIGVLILSLAVYLFVTFGSTSAELHKQQATDRLNEFNSQFTSYEGKERLTIYDVITVANLATENNNYYDIETKNLPSNALPKDQPDYYISVFVGNTSIAYGSDINSNVVTSNYQNLINQELARIQPSGTEEELPTYICKTDTSTATKRVYKVVFTEKP